MRAISCIVGGRRPAELGVPYRERDGVGKRRYAETQPLKKAPASVEHRERGGLLENHDNPSRYAIQYSAPSISFRKCAVSVPMQYRSISSSFRAYSKAFGMDPSLRLYLEHSRYLRWSAAAYPDTHMESSRDIRLTEFHAFQSLLLEELRQLAGVFQGFACAHRHIKSEHASPW
ncbi:hypothetical protein VTK73DRAFT_7198 [Phialemonium thermophilum]|uniref:Uncharacterized protein n=1 Tax=Phialemonium thermophilum TaxID=223376 RepID=A0ABR3WFX0_9PEZI